MKTRDIALLMALQENARTGLKELAKAARMPVSTAHDRVKQLEKEGVIRKYMAVLDGDKVGKPATAFVLVSLRYHVEGGRSVTTQREVAQKVARLPQVQEAHVITGEWDMLLKVKAASTREVGEFLFAHLREIPGIDKTVTFESVMPIKEAGPIDLSQTEENEAKKRWLTPGK